MKHVLTIAAIWLTALWLMGCDGSSPTAPTSANLPIATPSAVTSAVPPPVVNTFRAFISGEPNIWQPGQMLVFYAGDNDAKGTVTYTWTVTGPRYAQQGTGQGNILSLTFQEGGWATVALSATDGQTDSGDHITQFVHVCVQAEACF